MTLFSDKLTFRPRSTCIRSDFRRKLTTCSPKKQAKAFDVLEPRPIEVAVGDKLLVTANRRDGAIYTTNGEIVTVSGLDGNGRLHLEDGRVLPSNFRQFTHGYAVTAHRCQGKSVDAVIISADGMQKELFYVAASRGREQIATTALNVWKPEPLVPARSRHVPTKA